MGLYVLEENKTAQLRPVYKKTDGDYYIFYTSKLYFILVISGSQLYLLIIAADSRWLIGREQDIRTSSGWIRSEKTGLQTIPTSGWEYSDPDLKPWQTDDTLQFIYN